MNGTQNDLGVGQSFDYRRLRGILATERISHKQFAQACGLSQTWVARILIGSRPGELALLKIARGLASLGLSMDASQEREARRAS